MNGNLSEDQLKDYLADAVAETYHQDDLEADRDPEARQHLLHDLNHFLAALGLNDHAGVQELERPGRLAALVREAPSVAVALREFPNRVREWAAERPDRNSPDHRSWAEKGRWLLSQARLESQE
jgi:hypothetical protein